MRKIALIPFLIVAVLVPLGKAGAAPAGPETNPLGTLRWLPDNTNENGLVPAGLNRLVVIYDRSLNDAGKPANLLAKGTFGVKFASALPEVRMKGHSPNVGATQDAGAPSPAFDEVFAGIEGDIRDGACSKAGTSAFSAAFTTTRTFFHAGTSPYQPQTGSGACEVVQASTPVSGGFSTRVTTYVPGFWIDVQWPKHEDELGSGGEGNLLAEVWYSAVYDKDGDSTPFYQPDAAGVSDSVGSPGDYDQTFAFAGRPGAIGAPCSELEAGEPPADPGTYQSVKFQVSGGARSVSVRLFPKADWDLFVTDPAGTVRSSGRGPGFDENVSVTNPISGQWTMTACSFSGEPSVIGGVIVS